MNEHNSILDRCIEVHSGTLIKTVGDSYMVDFPSVLNAIACSVDIQKSLEERNRSADEQMDLRIGIHAGDVVYRDGDIFGDCVNIASRTFEPIRQRQASSLRGRRSPGCGEYERMQHS